MRIDSQRPKTYTRLQCTIGNYKQKVDKKSRQLVVILMMAFDLKAETNQVISIFIGNFT